jgi:integrase
MARRGSSAPGHPATIYANRSFRARPGWPSAGVPKVRFHDLRHTSASLMLNNGIPVIIVSKILGHSKPSITLDIYGHLYNEMQSEASRLMDELVSPVKLNLAVKDPQEVTAGRM